MHLRLFDQTPQCECKLCKGKYENGDFVALNTEPSAPLRLARILNGHNCNMWTEPMMEIAWVCRFAELPISIREEMDALMTLPRHLLVFPTPCEDIVPARIIEYVYTPSLPYVPYRRLST